MKRLFQLSLTGLQRLFIWLTLLTAALLIIGRLLVPFAADYRLDAQQLLEQALGYPVTISALRGDWSGFGPELVIYGLTITPPRQDQAALKLEEVHITFGLLQSLLNRQPVIRQLTLSAPQLHIIRQKNGSITLDDFALPSPAGAPTAAGLQLPRQIKVRQGSLVWEDRMTGTPPLQLSNVYLWLHNAPDRHQLKGSFLLPGQQQGQTDLAIDLEPAQTGEQAGITWSAKSYLKGSGVALDKLSSLIQPNGLGLRNTRAAFELWGNWNSHGLQMLQGSGSIEQLAITADAPATDPYRLNIDHLSSRFRLQPQATGWQLDLADLHLSRNKRARLPAQLGLFFRRDAAGQMELRGGSDRVQLEDIAAIGRLFLPRNGKWDQLLANTHPRGEIDNLQVRFDSTGQSPRWSTRGQLRLGQAAPWQALPGINSLQADFQANQQQGLLNLNSRNASATFPGLFRDPLLASRLTGQLSWQQEADDSWSLSSRRLQLDNQDIQTQTRVKMRFPASAGESVFLDLQTDFQDGDTAAAGRYLPAGIMPKNVVQWVDQSIGSGRVTAGTALVRGPLRDFPFENTHTGRFEVFFNTEKLHLDYWPGWPKIEQLNADVRFLNNSLDIWAKHGNIFNSELQPTHARIARLNPGSPLELTGRVKGPLEDHLKLLNESPLREDFATLAQQVSVTGEAELEIRLSQPINDSGAFSLDGAVNFHNDSLQLSSWDLQLDEVNGRLQFDQQKIFSKTIHGRLQQTPVTLRVSAAPNDARATRITARANITSEVLQQRFPQLTALQQTQGRTAWQLQVDIPHIAAGPDAPVSIAASSDLQGLAINLPEPLGKREQQQRPFRIETAIYPQRPQSLRLRLADLLDVNALIGQTSSGPKLERIGIALGGSKATLPSTSGAYLHGQLAQLDLDQWLALAEPGLSAKDEALPRLQQVNLKIDQLALGGEPQGPFELELKRAEQDWQARLKSDWLSGDISLLQGRQQQLSIEADLQQLTAEPLLSLRLPPKAGGRSLPIEQIHLKAKQVQLGQNSLRNFDLALEHDNASWRGTIHTERSRGTLHIPDTTDLEPVRISLDNLYLSFDPEYFAGRSDDTRRKESLNPDNLPAIQAQIGQLYINDKAFGELSLSSSKQPHRINLDSFSLNSDRQQLTASGSWSVDENRRQQSRLSINFSAQDLGNLLSDLKFAKNIDGAPTTIVSQLNWPGDPLAFNPSILYGEIGFNIEKGRFLDVDPGVGRIFGLLNLSALQRRLRLDFSDIFKKGFVFDRITSSFILDAGDAFTTDFIMQGPSANIEISGRVGLVDEDFDQLTTITPTLSSSIPLAGAIAGGPAVGAALFLAQRLIGERFDQATQLHYMVTGSWDNPLLTPLRKQSPDNRLEQETHPFAKADSPATETATVPTPAAPQTVPQQQPAEQQQQQEPVKKKPGILRRLLDKLKPTGPTFEQ